RRQWHGAPGDGRGTRGERRCSTVSPIAGAAGDQRPHLTLRKRPPARGGAAMTIHPAHLDVLRQMRHVASPGSNAQAEDARRQRISARIVELQRQPIVAERHPTRWHLALGAGVAVAAAAVLWLTYDTPAPEPATSSEFAQVVEGR